MTTIEFLKENAWLLSSISIISTVFLVVDKVKTWREKTNNDKLKRDKALLYSIVNLNVENFHVVESYGNGGKNYHPEYSKLYHIFQQVDTSKLINKEIKVEI